MLLILSPPLSNPLLNAKTAPPFWKGGLFFVLRVPSPDNRQHPPDRFGELPHRADLVGDRHKDRLPVTGRGDV